MANPNGHPEELPSFGFSENWGTSDRVQATWMNILNTNVPPVIPSVPPGHVEPHGLGSSHSSSASSTEEGVYPEDGDIFISRGVSATRSLNDAAVIAAGSSDNVPQEIVIEETQEFIDDLPMDYVDLKPKLGPKLVVRPNKYQRFRYPSERPDKKKPRHYEMEEDKRVLADVSIENYEGKAKIIVVCVNEGAKMHPFYLFGDNCTQGVYAQRASFGRRCPKFRLLRVSVTTPKQKDYQEKLRDHHNYLQTKQLAGYGLHIDQMDLTRGIGNKHVVQLLVIAVLDDGDQTILQTVTESIQNKKEGEEFLVHRISPCAGPCNPPQADSSTVSIIVSDKTAFPKDIGVRIRDKERDGEEPWEVLLLETSLNIIRKAVVEFTLPPYKNPDSVDDVEVEISLVDLKERNRETLPCTFTYQGSDAEAGLHHKRKKARLSEAFLQGQTMVEGSPVESVAGHRKVPLSARRRNPNAVSRSETSSTSSTTYPVVSQYATSKESIEETRTPATRLPVDYTDIRSNQPRHSAIVTSAQGSLHSSQPKQSTSVSAPQSQINWSTHAPLSATFLQQQLLQQQQQQQLLPIEKAFFQQSQQQQQTPGGSATTNMNAELQDIIVDASLFESLNLPKLQGSLQYALIDGQICIINDDTTETSPQSIQNIGGQNVVVQELPLQHPSDGGGGAIAGTSLAHQSRSPTQQQLLIQPGLVEIGAASAPDAAGQIPQTVNQAFLSSTGGLTNEAILQSLTQLFQSQINKGTTDQQQVSSGEQLQHQQADENQQQTFLAWQQQQQPSYQLSGDLGDDDDLEEDGGNVPTTVTTLNSMRLDHCYNSPRGEVIGEGEAADDSGVVMDP